MIVIILDLIALIAFLVYIYQDKKEDKENFKRIMRIYDNQRKRELFISFCNSNPHLTDEEKIALYFGTED